MLFRSKLYDNTRDACINEYYKEYKKKYKFLILRWIEFTQKINEMKSKNYNNDQSEFNKCHQKEEQNEEEKENKNDDPSENVIKTNITKSILKRFSFRGMIIPRGNMIYPKKPKYHYIPDKSEIKKIIIKAVNNL